MKKNLLTIIILAALVFFIAKYAGLLSLGALPEFTAYNTFDWQQGKLLYSGIFHTGSGNRMDLLTTKHNYLRWSNSQYFGWDATEDINWKLPPEKIRDYFKTPQALAENMTCKVYGKVNTMYKYNDGGPQDVYEPFSYSYVFNGQKVEWLGKEKGFRCVLDETLFELPAGEGRAHKIYQNILEEWCKVKPAKYITPCTAFAPIVQGYAEFSFSIPEMSIPVMPDKNPSLNLDMPNNLLFILGGILSILLLWYVIINLKFK